MSVPMGDSPRAIAEPMLSAARSRLDWTSRARENAHATERYTRFVIVAKRVLLIAAAALLGAVLVYSLQPRQQNSTRLATMSFQRLGIVNNDLAMLKPRLTGEDDSGDPYVVTADEAFQDHLNAKRARLQNVEGDVTLKDGSWITSTAPAGFLDATNARRQTLQLVHKVDVYSNNGYEAHTTAVSIDMGSGMITGNRPVSGQGPLGTFRADRFKIDRANRIVYLYSNVQMTIYGHMKRGQ